LLVAPGRREAAPGRIELVEELHDHLGLRQTIEHRNAAVRRVQFTQPLRAVGEVDLDDVVVDALLRERDPDACAVRAAQCVDELHASSPISAAICS
jgi:hypothetical protein